MLSGRYKALFFSALCSGYVVLAGAAFAATEGALSQNKDTVQNTIEDSDSWYGKTIFERPRSEYANDGVSVGSFKIKPSVDLSESFDSNIYATSTSKQEDFITKIRPLLSVQSDWSRHALGFNASSDLGYYADNKDENYGDYSAGVSGRLDILRETFLLGTASSAHLHEDRGNPNSNAAANEPTEYTHNNAGVSVIRNLRKVSLKLDGDFNQYNFENDETDAGTVLDNSGRDRNEYKATARIGYEIIPEYEAFLRTSLNERDYNNEVSVGGTNRDSKGYEVVAGTALNLGGKTKGEIFAGYLQQNYDSAALEDIGGVQYGADVLWSVTGLTSVKLGVAREVQETVQTGSSGYISTLYSARVEHEILYNLLAGIKASYNVNDYESTSGTDRSDDIVGTGVELKYLLNRHASVLTSYNYTNRDSNQAGQDYNQSVVMIGIRIEM